MRRSTVVYASLAVADSVLAGMGNGPARRLTKPLLMPLLALSVPQAAGDLRASVGLSGAGDVALMGQGDAAFAAGLSCFLGAHLGYLRVLDRLRGGHRHVPATLALAGVGAGQGAVLARAAGPLAGPVLAYSGVISAMGSAALSVSPLDDVEHAAVRRLRAGALLFMLSDSLVGTRRFLAPERLDRQLDAAVMATYTLAQWLLVTGAARLDARRRQQAGTAPSALTRPLAEVARSAV